LQDLQKEKYVENLGEDQVIAIGNGRNDSLMLQKAALGIAVMQQEGMYSPLSGHCDILCNSVTDALNLLLKSKRIIATLRK
jgi:soluble P-type ATPase